METKTKQVNKKARPVLSQEQLQIILEGLYKECYGGMDRESKVHEIINIIKKHINHEN